MRTITQDPRERLTLISPFLEWFVFILENVFVRSYDRVIDTEVNETRLIYIVYTIFVNFSIDTFVRSYTHVHTYTQIIKEKENVNSYDESQRS